MDRQQVFSLYYHPSFGGPKVYLDGSNDRDLNLYDATDLANDNASSMPEQYIYVENAATLKIVYAVINRNGTLVKSDRR